MSQERKSEALLEELEEGPLGSRRHRPAAEVKLPSPPSRPAPPSRVPPARPLGDAARTRLWADVREVLFEASAPAVVRRVWSSPPLGALADRMPPDIADVLEQWFMLVETSDVYRFLESVHDAIEPSARLRFVANVNALLDHAEAGYRFVLRRLLPLASRSDSAAIERALTACRTAHLGVVEASLIASLDYLGEKPDADAEGAIRSASTAAQLAATAVTGTSYAHLGEALADLEARGAFAAPLRSAYAGLVAYVGPDARKTSEEEARLIVLTCAGLVTHLASRT